MEEYENNDFDPTEEPGDIQEETTATVIDIYDRPFLSTPLDEYTVTEGLLLVMLVVVVFTSVLKLFTR